MEYFLVLDVGTTNVKALAFSDGKLIANFEKRLKPHYPKPGWVEEDPKEVIKIVYKLLDKAEEKLGNPLGVALTNQRSSTVLWDKNTGEPLYNMITWQDTRTEAIIEEFSSKFLVKLGNALGKVLGLLSKPLPFIKNTKKGAYIITLAYVKFGTTHSSMHLRWLIDNIAEVKLAIENGTALFGTVDSWIAWNLTGKQVTDCTNASATGLFDPFYLKWSDNIAKIVGIPQGILPSVVTNDTPIGEIRDYGIPLLTMIADQQASLYMAGVSKGTTKMTNGTGTFIDINVGEKPLPGATGLYPMIALGTRKKVLYLLEGSVITSGSAIDWLMNLGVLKDYSDIPKAFDQSEDEIIVIPALSGLGTPYVKPNVKGAIFELTRGTKKEDLICGMIKGIAMRCSEVIEHIEKNSQINIHPILADGGLSISDEFLQAVADFSSKQILRPLYLNGSAYGAYMLANAVYFKKDIIKSWKTPPIEKTFLPRKQKMEFKENWKKKVKKLIEAS
ncbi:glycerol kinase [Thermococcus sp. EP1]|uniref:FGGY family carbohydrate kinase n=1 Tax=Thermococcus sp. EP1 TaxID=1591054 RepID=UPI0006DB7E81|nr:FGGY family carbohydrate kinase [Thermococcus sp. EP1]KPU62881.1 glycerol kinase [Thermococcus sp. EP1]